MGVELFPHQKKGLLFALPRERTLDISETGCGKTQQMIAIARAAKAKRILGVVPGIILQNNIVDEFAMANIEAKVLKTVKDYDPSVLVNIVSYQSIMYGLRPLLLELRPTLDFVFFDEAHYLGNRKSKRSKLWANYLTSPVRAHAMTATLQNKSPLNAVSLLSVMGLVKQSMILYRNTLWIEKNIGRQVISECVDWKDERLTRETLAKVAIHYTKAEVLKHIPPTIHRVLRVPVSEAKIRKRMKSYMSNHDCGEALVEEYIEDGSIDGSGVGMAVLTAALRACAMEKVPGVAEYVAELAETEQVCVWGRHTEPLDALEEELNAVGVSTVLVHNGVKAEDRPALAEKFKRGQAQVFIGTAKTCGHGINLFNACRVVHLENAWDPADKVQAENRCHRHGQTKQVIAETAVADGNGSFHRIERAVLRNNAKKMNSAAKAGLGSSLGAVENPAYS